MRLELSRCYLFIYGTAIGVSGADIIIVLSYVLYMYV